MKLLHLDSSILGGNSVSRILSASAVAKLKLREPAIEVIYRDLAADPIPHLSGAYLGALQGFGGAHEPSLQHDLALSETLMSEFLAADTIVMGVAFYNFGIPSQLKAWIDRVVVAGKTFRYTEEGMPEGLAGAKRMIITIARGGFYGQGSPAEAAEHAESYLRAAMGFIGIHQLEVIAAEGIAIGAEQREAAIAGAERGIAALAA